MSHDYEAERTASRVEAAAVLSGVVDGLLAGALRLGEGDQAVTVDAPEELSLEVELETRDGDVSLELEMEWPEDSETNAVDVSETDLDVSEIDTAEASADSAEWADEPEADTGAADDSQSLARFEVFEDRGGEYRWRLRHRNGNIIATSGEGYTRKHNAWKGLRSVVKNAPNAELTEEA